MENITQIFDIFTGNKRIASLISLPYFKDDRSHEGNKPRQGETSLLSLRSSKHPSSEIGRSVI